MAVDRSKEKEFISLWRDAKLTAQEQDRKGVDVVLTLKVDVKAMKKVKRSDQQLCTTHHWVEIKNVNGGRGWLYNDIDYFAFETVDSWIMVPASSLVEHLHSKGLKLPDGGFPEYMLHYREGRNDLMTLVPNKDLKLLGHEILKQSD